MPMPLGAALSRTLRAMARMAIVAMPGVLGAQSSGPTPGGFYYSDTSGSVTIVNYAGTGGAVVIPATIGGDPVTTIAPDAFDAQATVITSISIPAGVTSIPTSTAGAIFAPCTSLASIVVDPANSSYSSANNLLYDKAQLVVLECPPDLSGAPVIAATVT
jgi:hypothetical protein